MTAEVCQTCGSWRRTYQHPVSEATEYRDRRPCPMHLRPAFVGQLCNDTTGQLILTSPGSRCDFWTRIPEGAR